jgi:acetyl-CoA carboxylase biotin carboxyl carrier protein
VSKLEEMKEIVAMALESPVHEFSLECEDIKISFKKADSSIPGPVADQRPPAAAGSAPEPVVSNAVSGGNVALAEPAPMKPRLAEISSIMIGTFYAGPEPDASPFVKVGDAVADRTVVGIVEAMKMYHEIEAEVNGVIEEILVENGQLVHFGQPLYVV